MDAGFVIARAAAPVVLVADILCLNWLWVGTVIVWMVGMRCILAVGR